MIVYRQLRMIAYNVMSTDALNDDQAD